MISQLRLEHSSLGVVAKVWIYELSLNINISVDYSLKMLFSLLYVYCSLAFNDVTSFCSLPSVTLSNFCSISSMNNRSPSIVCYSDHKKNEYIYEAHCMHHYTHTVIHTYKWSNDRSIRIILIWHWYSRAEWSTVTLLMADISRNTIMDKTTHNSQRYVSRGSQIPLCPFLLTS